jgi:hypothetical protein
MFSVPSSAWEEKSGSSASQARKQSFQSCGAPGLGIEQMQGLRRQRDGDPAADRRVDHAMGDGDQKVAADLDAEMALIAQPVVRGDGAVQGARSIAQADPMGPHA